jgi:hypothetical protein
MNELLAKLTSYNIFNNLVPGALYCLAAKWLRIIDLTSTDVATNLLTYYLVGMALSRIGSLIIEPAMKRLNLISYSEYANFVRAAAKDPKVDILVETNNTYRSVSAALICLALGYLLTWIPAPVEIGPEWQKLGVVTALALLFTASYAKQTGYIKARVDAHHCEENSDASR